MIRIGIVGVGGFGARHVTTFGALETEGIVKVCALADTSSGSLSEAAQSFRDVNLYGDLETMLNGEPLDAVVLSTPIPLHEEMLREVLSLGLHVLLEKPAVPLFSQLIALKKLPFSERVAVGFQRISAPSMQVLKAFICDGGIGRLRSLSVAAVWPRSTSYYQRSGWAGQVEWKGRAVLDGPATNALSHWLHNLMFLAGESYETSAVPNQVYGEAYRARRMASYDTAVLGGAFCNDVKFSAGFSHAASSPLPARLRVEGTKGVVWMLENGELAGEGLDLPDYEMADEYLLLRRRFVEFAEGKLLKPDVALDDVAGYTLATNMMFQSSRGIHALESSFVEDCSEGKSEFCVIKNIHAHLIEAVQRFTTLSDVGASWASPCASLDASAFDEGEMLKFLRADHLCPRVGNRSCAAGRAEE